MHFFVGLGPLGGKLVGLGLAEGAKRGLRLRVLQLGRSRQENKGAVSIAAALAAMGSLEEIIMPQNGIKATGIAALAEAVKANRGLRVLDLNDNTFRAAGCRAMAAALADVHGLRAVNFGDCLLGPAGFDLIANALTGNHANLEVSLGHLSLSLSLSLSLYLSPRSRSPCLPHRLPHFHEHEWLCLNRLGLCPAPFANVCPVMLAEDRPHLQRAQACQRAESVRTVRWQGIADAC